MPGRVLLVFVKAPRPGQVKTRLAAAIGDEAAAAAYRALAEGVLARTAAQAAEWERIVFFAPPDARDEVAAWLPGETLVAQDGPDLGARMDNAFAEAFARGARAAVLVGSDIPGLHAGHVREAFAALERVPVVLGPAADGGYYLVGLRERRPELFNGMEWGAATVLEVTRRRCRSLGLAVHLVETLSDVDTPEDLGRSQP